jgi:hypothetical protein
MLKFYANINGTNEGPFTLEELKDLASKKKITPKTYVIIEGTEDWIAAKEIEGLFPPGAKLPKLPPTPPGGDTPLTAEDAARIARQSAAAAKQGAQMAVAYGASITSKSTGFWGGVINFIKKILNEGIVTTIIAKLSTAGIYAMVLAALAILAIAILSAVKNSEVSHIFIGLFLVFALSLTQYFASRFMDSGERVISSTPTRMGSDALIEAIALITFLLALGSLVGGIISTLQSDELWPAMVGIALFLSGMLIVGISLNPAMLNINIGESSSAGQEAIGIISFGYKSWLRAIPAVFGILSILGSLQLVWGFIKMLVGDLDTGIAIGSSGGIMVFVGGLYPVIGLLIFLFSYLTIDIISSILSIPGKLDAMARKGG